jgi:AcrR family transcriptional regulator
MARGATYHHGDLRAALVRAATEILESEGLEKLSLRSVARQVGVSHAAPYHHFPDRMHLIAAVARVGFEGLTAAMRAGIAALPDDADALDKIDAIGVAYVGHATEHPATFQVMFRPELTGDPEAHPELQAAGSESFGVLVETIVLAQETGLVAPGDPQPLAIGAWSAVHGVSVLWVDGPLRLKEHFGNRTVDELARLVTAQVRRALART